jgi:hypothetical protein
VFHFRLAAANGEPHDPAVLVTTVPNWEVGEKVTLSDGSRARILGIETKLRVRLLGRGFNGVFTVEPA